MFAGKQKTAKESWEIMGYERTVCQELRILSRMIKRHADAAIAAHFDNEVTDVQGRVIGFLYHNTERPIYQKDVEAEFSITRATTSKMLSLMERNGLIVRLPVAMDGRLKELRLTEKAQAFAQRVHRGGEEFDRIVTRGLTDEEQQVLLRALRKMQDNVLQAAKERGE